MSSCDAELCPMWDGETCPCETFGFDRRGPPTSGIYTTTSTDQPHSAP